MKTQKVSVDAWAMLMSMAGYVVLVILGGIFIRLILAALTLPGRLRKQRDTVEKAMEDLKRKYPEAFKEYEEMIEGEKSTDEEKTVAEKENTSEVASIEDKKSN